MTDAHLIAVVEPVVVEVPMMALRARLGRLLARRQHPQLQERPRMNAS
jgi:hypothetical protein